MTPDPVLTETPEAPSLELDPVVAMQEAGWRMKRIRALLERRRIVEESATEQLGEITVWRDQQVGSLNSDVERLKLSMEPYVAALVASEPQHKRSVNLVAGVAGYRAGREKVIVEDEEAAQRFLIGQGTSQCIRTTRVVDIPALKKRWPQPDVIPGIRVEKGDDKFYADPIGRPSDDHF
jgi:phage host-nuclease inhibitor protein Gam